MQKRRVPYWYGPNTGKYWTGQAGRSWPVDPPWQLPVLYNSGLQDLQISEGHPHQLLGKTNRNIGGDFAVVEYKWEGNELPYRAYNHVTDLSTPGNRYEGHVIENTNYNWTNGTYPSQHMSSEQELKTFATSVIANILPTNPVSGLFTALGELKNDGIPTVHGVQAWRDRTLNARNAGSEYLNHQFGWLPLLNDLKKFGHATTNSDELIEEYARNSGKRIKRLVEIPIDETITTARILRKTAPDMPFIYHPSNNHQICNVTVTKSKRRWLKACFSYYLPPYKPNGNNVARNEQLLNYLYGTRPTPGGLWDLTPWSWAVDWVSNFGDVFHNIGQFQMDGLVMPYCYIMEEGIHSVNYSHPEVRFRSYPSEVNNLWATVTTTVKQRYGASPYGFGLDIGAFTLRQWSILAALGLTKGDKKLWN